MRYLSFAVVGLVGLTAVAASSQGIPSKVARQPVTLSGCVAAGEKPNTFLLTHVASTADAVGTSGSSGMPIYWLDSPSKLKSHVGQQVEIVGTLDGDVDKTKVKEKDGNVEVKADGKAVKVPEGTRAADALPPAGAKSPGYKVKVKSVKMLAASCQ